MNQEEMLENEKVEKILSPHPLSFMKLQSLCIFLIIWGVLFGWLVNVSEYKGILGNELTSIFVWGIVLIVVGVFASLVTIRWIIFFFYLGIVAAGAGLILWQGWQENIGIFIPFYTVAVSVIGFLIVELYRRSHKYFITNFRIITQGGISTKRRMSVNYEKISNIGEKQGVLGQIFDFGTIIPISESGLGLGSDQSFAAGGLGVAGKKVHLVGLFGGGKEVKTPRSRSFYELHGVYPFKEIRKLVNQLQHKGGAIAPKQQEQVDMQKEQAGFQKEQIDIQKQMRDLLKKQMGGKEEQKEEESEGDS
jgi:hypothetical protein